jgi:hypothetical protein
MALVDTVWTGEKEEKHMEYAVSDYMEHMRMVDDILADRNGWS